MKKLPLNKCIDDTALAGLINAERGDDTTQQVTIDDVNAAANSRHAFGGAMNTDGERDDVCRRLYNNVTGITRSRAFKYYKLPPMPTNRRAASTAPARAPEFPDTWDGVVPSEPVAADDEPPPIAEVKLGESHPRTTPGKAGPPPSKMRSGELDDLAASGNNRFAAASPTGLTRRSRRRTWCRQRPQYQRRRACRARQCRSAQPHPVRRQLPLP